MVTMLPGPHSPLRRRLGAAIGLLFLTGAFSDLGHASLPGWRLGLICALVAAFVILYVSLLPPARVLVCRLGNALPPVAIGMLISLTAAVLALGAPHAFLALVVYVAAVAGLMLPPVHAVRTVGACTAAVAVAGPSFGESGSWSGSYVLTVAAIGLMMVGFGRQVRTNRELIEARGELARLAVSEERLRIARDLHDLLGHSLSVVALKTDLAAKLIERDPERALAELNDVRQVARRSLVEVRDAVQGYRRLALCDAVAGARAALGAAGIECRVEGAEVDLPEELETVLAWAVREATTNVVRHSGARACAIRIRSEEAHVEVEVSDDGTAAADGGRQGSGLAGLAERAARFRGDLEAGRRPEGGFCLRLSLPRAVGEIGAA
jgi:two-component system, NarL family, sensor histidine kinase DesK